MKKTGNKPSREFRWVPGTVEACPWGEVIFIALAPTLGLTYGFTNQAEICKMGTSVINANRWWWSP